MRAHRLSHGLLILFLSLYLGPLGCQGERVIFLKLDPELLQDASHVVLKSKWRSDGQPDVAGSTIDQPLPEHRFALEIPESLSGLLLLDVAAITADGCTTSSGSLEIELPAGQRYPLEKTMELELRQPHRCPLRLSIPSGPVSILGDQGLLCGAFDSSPADCELEFARGTALKLSAQRPPSTFGHYFHGACSGDADCSFTLNRAEKVVLSVETQPCDSAGFCWQRPMVAPETLNAVWAVSATSAWALGENGAILRFDGERWRAPSTSRLTGNTLRAIVGTDTEPLWAVGDKGTILKFAQGSFQAAAQSGVVTSARLNGVWASGPDDAWMVGSGGVLVQYANQSFRAQNISSYTLHGIWGRDPQGIFAVGDGATILAYDQEKSTWSAMVNPAPPSTPLRAIHGDATELWAVGDAGVVLRYQAGSWKLDSQAMVLAAGRALTSVHRARDGSIWIGGSGVLLRMSGGIWRAVSEFAQGGLSILGIGGASDDSLFVVGETGLLGRFSGQVLRSDDPPLPGMNAIWADGNSALWSVGAAGTIVHHDGVTWRRAPESGVVTTSALLSIFGSGDTLWAVGHNGVILQRQGSTWQAVSEHKKPSELGTRTLHSVWGTSATDIWIAGDGGMILHRDPYGTFQRVTSPEIPVEDLHALWGPAPGELWSVGKRGTVLHFRQNTWTAVPSTELPAPRALYAIWGSSDRDIWIAGELGTLWHLAAGTFRDVRSGSTSGDLLAISGRGPDDVFIVGTGGLRLRWDGQTLRNDIAAAALYPNFTLTGLCFSATNDVFIAGRIGALGSPGRGALTKLHPSVRW